MMIAKDATVISFYANPAEVCRGEFMGAENKNRSASGQPHWEWKGHGGCLHSRQHPPLLGHLPYMTFLPATCKHGLDRSSIRDLIGRFVAS